MRPTRVMLRIQDQHMASVKHMWNETKPQTAKQMTGIARMLFETPRTHLYGSSTLQSVPELFVRRFDSTAVTCQSAIRASQHSDRRRLASSFVEGEVVALSNTAAGDILKGHTNKPQTFIFPAKAQPRRGWKIQLAL